MFLSPEVRVLEASAGSGKTYALARRYVQLLLHLGAKAGAPLIHTILAITFTHKAAFEMKARILKFLKQIALGLMPEPELQQMIAPLGLSAEEARRLASAAMDDILRRYNYFQVQTIDKFIHALLVGAAFEIGLTADFKIRTGVREYLGLALDALIDEAAHHAGVRQDLDDFLTSMMLVEARSAWIPREVVLDTMEKLFSEYNTYARPFIHEGKRPQELVALKAAVLADIRQFAADMPAGAHDQFVKSINKCVATYENAFSFKGLSDYFHPDKPIRLRKGAVASAAQTALWDKVQRGLVHAAGLEVAHLYDPYIRLFERVHGKFGAFAARADIVFLSQLNAMAREAYARGLGVDELYYRFSTRFAHYLFDEFQDTSLLQWENLKALPEDALASGGSLFYVGDKKQAIYSFRGGDTRLFDALAGSFSDPGYNCRRDVLERNFRSHAAIVDFNNKVFGLENLRRLMHAADEKGEPLVPARACDDDELVRIYGGAQQQAALGGPSGCVRIEVLSGGKKDDLLEDARLRVLARLEALKPRFSWSQIAILVRKNEQIEEVTGWLLDKGIPVSSDRTLNVREHGRVREVVAFLKFLSSPVDNSAFAEFILGDIFVRASGISAEELQDFVLAWRIARKGYLYTAFRESYPEAWGAFIEDFFLNIGLYPLYEMTVSFYRRTRALELFPQAQGFLMHFLGLIKAKEEDLPGVSAFLEHYEALEGDELFVEVLIGASSGSAVRVMTVHKAKGLEFPVVILPFLTMGLKAGSSPGKKALAYTLRVEEQGLRLYHFTAAHLPYSPKAMDLDNDEDMAAFFSELNNLYVGLTRAACEMYGFIPLKLKNGRNLALALIPEEFFQTGEPASVYARKDAPPQGVPRELAPSACRDWISFLTDEFGP